ncbi:substrate-binding domain-containing protein [Streptomyces sp. WMMC500]|uniref:substrate-binding domain-containing protein n=1 Tax=Streptomyces sp. WMMC500 TaxID=3015154 RepID=UPI00248AC255|nr:substrate-binding domain-containing protein [Streptomyces sp. WMMC500]WBB63557.1 substrate-binding domain-containing protein [Streptomyces sp. WMMC500]
MSHANAAPGGRPPGNAPVGLPRWARLPVLATGLALLLAALLSVDMPRAYGASYVKISGAGSTWSQNAIDEWVSNVRQFGMPVDYKGVGSSQGRTQFKNGTVDYGVSEIPYGLKDSATGVTEAPPSRDYAYMPIVAGGTAFMYNLEVSGRKVTNLRLSGSTVTGIFTGKIKYWNDAAVRRDNPGLSLPRVKVVPVVRSDGSGTTAQFTEWMSQMHGGAWNDYCRAAGRSTPCGMTSNYPTLAGSGFISQATSLGVSGYVRQDHAVGAITYVEYSYARNTGFPVAKVLNKSDYYVEPTASSVAVALTRADINDNKGSVRYLTQELDRVYRHTDRRAYPLSSYSYMILPTSLESGMTNKKGRTLGAFGHYFLCEGQQNADDLGYSPLPANLVKAGFTQVNRVPGAQKKDPGNLRDCKNPTIGPNGNSLLNNAPYPPACDKKDGPTQCATGTGGAKDPTPVRGGGSGDGTGSGGGTGGPGNGDGDGTGPDADGDGDGDGDGSGADSGGGADGAGGPGDGAVIDPETGEVLGDGTDGAGSDVIGTSVGIGAEQTWGMRTALMLLSAAMLVGVVVAPPVVSRYLDNRRRRRGRAA